MKTAVLNILIGLGALLVAFVLPISLCGYFFGPGGAMAGLFTIPALTLLWLIGSCVREELEL